MATQKTQAVSNSSPWITNKRYRVNESIIHNGNVYQNITGFNSEPGTSNDWLILYEKGIKNVIAGTNVTIDYANPSNPIINSTGGGGGGGDPTLESVSISNLWNHGTSFDYLRNTFYGGFNRDQLNTSTGVGVITDTQIILSGSFYATSESRYLKNVIIDCFASSGTVYEWTISIWAYQKINTSPFILNSFKVADVIFTKGIDVHAYLNTSPPIVEIPADFLLTCFVKKNTGTGYDLSANITFKFEKYA